VNERHMDEPLSWKIFDRFWHKIRATEFRLPDVPVVGPRRFVCVECRRVFLEEPAASVVDRGDMCSTCFKRNYPVSAKDVPVVGLKCVRCREPALWHVWYKNLELPLMPTGAYNSMCTEHACDILSYGDPSHAVSCIQSIRHPITRTEVVEHNKMEDTMRLPEEVLDFAAAVAGTISGALQNLVTLRHSSGAFIPGAFSFRQTVELPGYELEVEVNAREVPTATIGREKRAKRSMRGYWCRKCGKHFVAEEVNCNNCGSGFVNSQVTLHRTKDDG